MPTRDGAGLPDDVATLVEQKKFDELEDLWTARMEADPADLPFFFAVAAAVKKKGGGAQAVSWLRFLADYEGETTDPDARLTVLLEIARMSPTDSEVRGDLEKELKARFGFHPAFAAVAQQNPIAGAADPGAAADRIRRWLAYSPGDVYAMPGRGAGRIVELNPALDVIRLDLGGTRVPFSLVSAEKTLTRLPEGHFLRRKVEDPAGLKALADRDPSETVRLMLESFARALTVAEVKDSLAGIVDEARWTAFWTAARKNPRLLVSGGGKTATVRWTESAHASEDAVRGEFERADPAHKLDLARKQAKRSKELASWMGERLAEEALSAAGRRQASLAWELSRAAAKLGAPEAFPASALLEAPDLASVVSKIRDQAARGEALEAARTARGDWYDLFAAHFLSEEDSRVLALLYDRLGESSERRDEIVRRVLRSPRQAPRAFVWLADRMGADAARIAPSLFTIVLDALRQDEFSSVRSKLKEFFDPGGLAVELARGARSEEQAREYLSALDRAGGLEEHRRALVKEALLMKFPELRGPAREWLYSTPEAIEARRKELTHLKSVELPANAEAMRIAKEHGDLSENFEYHAARQRHEYLSARIAALADELSRARPLDPARVDASEVRVGTRVRLKEVDRGAERSVTILGPWDSRPEESVYSYQSDFAQALLGSRPGDLVTLSGIPTEVLGIEPWK
jgi:transcription elongation GreA/GreB family factor